jgi:hypothetical protein
LVDFFDDDVGASSALAPLQPEPRARKHVMIAMAAVRG